MYFSKITVFKVVLPLVLVLSAFSGTVVEAATPTPPPAGTAVQLLTFGSMPVMMFNLTQSPINVNISTTQPAAYTSGGFPVAVGWSGVYYYQSNGTTPTFNNIISSAPASLMPVATISSPASSVSSAQTVKGAAGTPIKIISFNPQNNFMNLFTLFPSWSQPQNPDFYNTLYEKFNNSSINSNAGAVMLPSQSNTVTGYPNSNNKNAGLGTSGVNAYSLTAAQATACSINLMVQAESSSSPLTYSIIINSLGKGKSSYVAPPTGISLYALVDFVLDLVIDAESIIGTDGLAIAGIIAGLPATISGYQNQLSCDTCKTPNTGNAATNAGVNVTAQATTLLNSTLTPTYGDNNALLYEVKVQSYITVPVANILPLDQKNAVLIATWRQFPENTGDTETSSADQLIVAVINEGIYASNQIQQYINSHPSQSSTAKATYNPTKEQAQDTTKILAILTALSKDHPEDMNKIMAIFGLRGTYKEIQNNPSEMRNMNLELKNVFEKYKNSVPVVEQYLAKLEQKH